MEELKKLVCIYHGNCLDGFAAAWVVRQAFCIDKDQVLCVDKDIPLFGTYVDVLFHAADYNDPPPSVSGKDVIIVDFSYKPEVMQQIIEEAKDVLWIDHHASAIDAMRDIEHPKLRKYLSNDNTQSGAGLAWEFFFDKKSPFFIDAVEDRDLWKFRLPDTEAITSYLASHEYDFEVYDKLYRLTKQEAEAREAEYEKIILEGNAAHRSHLKSIKEIIRANEHEILIGGSFVPAVNVPHLMASDAGAQLAALNPEALFTATYYNKGNKYVVSLRSSTHGADVASIAQHYGGGGHKRAAGFSTNGITTRAKRFLPEVEHGKD